jgi:hypothetical protein
MRPIRQERLERELASLEEEFRRELVAALRDCAAGHWGVLGQNTPPADLAHLDRLYRSPAAERLLALGEEIEAVRRRLGLSEPFGLLVRFLEMRDRRGANLPGEPRRAREWLMELGEGPQE